MDAFTYLSVLLSIIIGLGMTQILTALGRLIRTRSNVVRYWPPLLWSGILLIIYVQVWWSMFGLRSYTSWTFLAFLVVLLQTIMLYMVAAVVLPDESEGGTVDLKEHYRRQAVWFFGFFAATLLVSVMKDVVLSRRLPAPVNLAFHCLFLVICAIGIVTRREIYHKAIALAGAAVFALYIPLLFWRLR
jgi:hypothetical protein